MRIAQIVCTYPPYYGGMGNVAYETASHLASFGHDVEVLTPLYFDEGEIEYHKKQDLPEDTFTKQEEQERELEDYSKKLKPALKSGNAAYMPQIKHELDRFDLVHLHYPFFGTANLVKKWKLKNPNKPLVITYHMDNRSPGWKGLIFKYYSKYWMPKILNSADLLIGSSLDYIESSDAGEIYKNNKKKWLELPFGVDVERFKPRVKPENLFAHHNLNSKAPTMVFVGGMDAAHYFKGIPVLLDALKILKKEEVGIQVVLVGEGELRGQFEYQAKVAGLENLVKFAGKVSNEELSSYYNMGDLLVLPSINQGEAFGMVLLEAMASGVPVVATDLAGVRKVAADGGMIVEPNNSNDLAEAILGYFSNRDNAENWKLKVRKTAEEKYAWESVIRKLDDAYQQLVKK